MVKKHLIIEGRCQGVGYRFWMKGEALRQGIKGWCKNLKDGKVEALIEGSDKQIKSMIDRCYQGPPLAKIKNILVEETTEEITDPNFTIK